MSKNILSPKIFSGSGLWGLSLLSIAFIVPLVLAKSLPQTQQRITAPSRGQNIETSSLPQPNLSFDETMGAFTDQNSGLKSPMVYQRQQPTVNKQQLANVKENDKATENKSLVKPKAAQPVPQAQTKQATATPAKQQIKQTATPQKKTYTPPLTPVNYNAPAIEIKVMLHNGVNSLTVSTSNTGAIADAQGKLLRNISANESLTVSGRGNSLIVDGETFPSVIWLEPNLDGLVYGGDTWYRGRLLLVSQGSGVLAVNYVDLEQYLYSVVGTEMHPTAPMEALKAQAVAARSYALVHMIRPASNWYHLGNTQRWQAYKGISKEYNTSQKAVNDTAGQILSYKGGIVESLYAATDEIVGRAHGGRGMSQTGAYKLAGNGYDYLQILANYYPGVGVARIVSSQ